MKKFQETIKPFLFTILGALIFLYYLNWLQYTGATLAMGIIAIIFASYYLIFGVIDLIIGNKLPTKIRDILCLVAISLYPLLMFIYFLLITIAGADSLTPTGWTINIISLIISLSFAVIYALNKFVKVTILDKINLLMSLLFTLVLVFNIVFDPTGNPNVLGGINIILLVMHITYFFILINALSLENKE